MQSRETRARLLTLTRFDESCSILPSFPSPVCSNPRMPKHIVRSKAQTVGSIMRKSQATNWLGPRNILNARQLPDQFKGDSMRQPSATSDDLVISRVAKGSLYHLLHHDT